MSLSDPIADMLTRIRNGYRVHRKTVNVMASKVCQGLCEVLKSEGYIEDWTRVENQPQDILRIYLKYTPAGAPVLTDIQRVSRPGRRVYRGSTALPRPLGGLGVSIVSTSKGVMSDRRARAEKVGGEVLCTVI